MRALYYGIRDAIEEARRKANATREPHTVYVVNQGRDQGYYRVIPGPGSTDAYGLDLCQTIQPTQDR